MTKEHRERKPSLWTRERIEQLIEQYRLHECLWNPYTDHYKDKVKRNKAIENICRTIQVTKPDFAKKIHNLRNQFNSEYKKYERRLEEAEELEDNSTKEYHCRWVHFESLMYLKNVITARPGSYQQSQQTKKLRLEAAGTNSSQTTLSGDEIAEYHIEEGSEEEFDGFETNEAKSSFQNEVLGETTRNNTRELITINSSNSSPTKYFTRMHSATVQIRPQPTQEGLKETPQPLNNETVIELATAMPQEKQASPVFKGTTQQTVFEPVRDQWSAFGEFIANEFRNYNSDLSRRKLKRKIMQAMLEVSEDDDVSSTIK